MNESLFETEKRAFYKAHPSHDVRCTLCGSNESAGELGWITLNHPNEGIAQFKHLCVNCCVRIADYIETIAS